MSLRMKAMAVLVPVMALLLSGLYALMSEVISRGFAETEQTHVQRNVERVRAAMEQEKQGMISTARDWGSWTDLYHWMASGDPAFVESSLALGNDGLDRLGLRFLAIGANLGDYRFAEQLGEVDAARELDAATRALILQHPELVAPSKEDGAQVGFVLADDTLMLLAGAPVLDSEERLDVRGSVILGRALDGSYLDSLSQRVGLDLVVAIEGQSQAPADMLTAAGRLGEGEAASQVEALSEDLIAGYFRISDPQGRTLAVVRLSEDRAIHRQGQLSLRYLLIVFVLAALAILAALSLLLNNVVLRRILQLSAEVNLISRSSDLTLRTSAGGRDEIGHLGREMNDMLRALQQAAEKERKYIREIDASLKLAASIQASMLPQDFREGGAALDLHASLIPAKTVGGDFYDFFWLDPQRFAFVVADVSGKGVPAGLFMVQAKMVIKAAATAGRNPVEIITRANDELSEGNDESMFVTALFCVLDTVSGELEIVSAGHNPPFLLSAGTAREERLAEQVVLGAMGGMEYGSSRLTIQPGDTVFAYTDGVNEAMDPDNVEFGYARLLAALQGEHDSAEAVNTAMVAAVQQFVRGAEQSDDITVMCVRWIKPGRMGERRR